MSSLRKESPLKNLRAVLFYYANKNPKEYKEVFSHYMELSLAKMRKERFFVGRLFGYRAGKYQVIWIDPYNYDCLVLDKKKRKALYVNFYGLIS
ncbi:hypothetical protein fHeYen902_198 [Yersinia phage fHe-Yen9-02]|nr:hypothetical protein fHeYen902_198 [Yersinia phage fHe-Yen9-02]